MKKEIIRIKPSGLASGSAVSECQNLVLNDVDGSVGLVPAPTVVAVAEGKCRPLATRYGADGVAQTLWARTLPGGAEGVWSNKSENEDVFMLIKENVSAHCAIATSDGFIVMTDAGPLTLFEQEDDGTLAVADGIDAIPEGVTLEGVDMGELTASTEAMTMTGVDFSRTSPQIRSSDAKALSESLVEAYNHLAATASDGGVWLQPVVARWHLISDRGVRLYSSPPIVVAPNGWQCMERYTVECEKSESNLAVPQIRISARAYRIKLNINEEAASRLAAIGVSSIKVDCTPQLHIIDTTARASIRLADCGTTTPKLTVALPGAADYFSSRESVYAEWLELIFSKIGDLSRSLMALHYPITAGDVIITPAISESVKEQRQEIKKIISEARAEDNLSTDAEFLASVGMPHSFTAKTATVSGRTVVWGDVTPILSTGLNVGQMCSGWVDGRSEGFAMVTRRDGGVYSTRFSFSKTPIRWASSVIIADSAAVKVEIYLRHADGGVWYGNLDLHRMADGCYSGNLSDRLVGKSFVQTGNIYPEPPHDSISENRKTGAILAANIETPLMIRAAADCCSSQIIKMMPAVKSQSSWDFSRCHIYALTPSGVYAVNLNTSRRAISSSLIDTRGAKDECSVTRADDSVVIVYRDRLLKLSASHAEDVGPECQFRQVAFDATTQRLWFLDRFGGLTVSDLAMESISRITTPFDVENIYSADNRLWISDSDGLYRVAAGEEMAQKQIPIVWRRNVDMPIGRRLRFVEIRFSARLFSGEIILRERAEMTDSRGQELMRLSLDREVEAPIKQRIAAANVPWLEVEMKGDVSWDFRFEEIIFHIV